MSDSPAVILFDANGLPLATEAGTSSASVITVQGDPDGIPIPVTADIEVTVPPVTVDTTGLATDAKQNEQTAELESIKTQLQTGTTAVSAASLPLPLGAATNAKLDEVVTAIAGIEVSVPPGLATETTLATRASETTAAAIKTAVEALVAALTNPLPVSGTVGVSNAFSLEATQLLVKTAVQAIQTAVQGTLLVDGSAHLQPVSDGGGSLTVDGTVTANIGTTNGLALDATLTGGTQKAVVRGGGKGSTSAADVTSTASGANNQSLDVIRRDASGNIAPTGDAAARASFVKVTDGTNTQPAGDTEARAIYIKSGTTALISQPGYDGVSSYVPLRVFDADTGGGTQNVLGTVLRKSASGGSVEAGTASDPLRVDPTGTTTQPVSIASPVPVTDNSGSLTVDSAQLPSSLGAKTTANSMAVNIASDQTVPVDVIASALPSGASTAAKQPDPVLGGAAYAGTEKGLLIEGVDGSSVVRTVKTDNTGAVAIQDNGSSLTVDASSWPLPTGAATDSVLTGGTQQAQLKSGTKGTSTAALVTSTASGSNHQPLDVIIYDAAGNPITTFGGGTEYTSGDPTVGAAEGGVAFGVESGNNAYPIAVDASGRQIVVGTSASPLPITDNSGSLTVDSTQLPAALLGGRLDTNTGAWLGSTAPSVGQKSMANSIPVAIASDQTLPYNADRTTSGTLTAAAQTVSISTGGCGAVAFYTSGTWSLTAQIEATVDGSNWVSVAAQAYGAGVSSIAPVTTSSIGSATNVNGVFNCAGYQNFRIRCSAYTSGTMTVALTASAAPAAMRVMQGAPSNIGNAWYQIVTDGTNTMPTGDAASRAIFHRVTDGTSVAAVKAASTAAVSTDPALVVETRAPSSATLSNVSGSASSVTLLSANTSRKSATIWNDSTAILYIKLGTTASTTSCTVKLIADAYYEVPGGYTGRIDGIWASATGSARVTEITV